MESNSFANLFRDLLEKHGINANKLSDGIKRSDGFDPEESQGISADSIRRYRDGKAYPQNDAWNLISDQLHARRVPSETVEMLGRQLAYERSLNLQDSCPDEGAETCFTAEHVDRKSPSPEFRARELAWHGKVWIWLGILLCAIAVYSFRFMVTSSEPIWQDDAEIISIEGWPKEVVPGEQFDVQIRVRNIGTNTWRKHVEDKCPYVLGFGDGSKGNTRYMKGSSVLTIHDQPHGDEHGAQNLLTLADDREVLPQKEITFFATLRVTATENGVYPIVFRMLRNGKSQADGQVEHPYRTWSTGWFGEIKSENQVNLVVKSH